jgi:SH3-like domain-containing protein
VIISIEMIAAILEINPRFVPLRLAAVNLREGRVAKVSINAHVSATIRSNKTTPRR